jgi:catechol 2,3-dioxygenase-like lactoylglutathione lyase family enzyme
MKKQFPALLVLFIIYVFHNKTAMAQSPRINHIAFYVVDLNSSATFYSAIIGLDTIPEPFKDGRQRPIYILYPGQKRKYTMIKTLTSVLPFLPWQAL